MDASVRWTWAPAEGSALTLVAAPGGVLARAGGTAAVLSAVSGTPGARHPAPGGLAAVVGMSALYLGESAVAVDLAYGRPLWTVPLPGAGATPVAATGRGVSAYLLARSTADGPTPLVWFDLSAGRCWPTAPSSRPRPRYGSAPG